MSISVIVPIYINEDIDVDMTKKCITLAKDNTDIPFTLIIVETCSEYFRDDADIYIHEEERTNATKSINRGFNVAKTMDNYVVLLTNDVFLNKWWLECLYQCFIEKDDCGIATLATNQLGHTKSNRIEEGIWFSIAMMRSEDAWFDENYVNSWDDSDLITRVYIRGDKMYRNYNCIAEHDPGQTHYKDSKHIINFDKNKKYYKDKWQAHCDSRIYKIITEGVVL